MRVFVTGGSGFLGQRLIQRLVQEGHQVMALARTAESASILRQQGCTTILGDLSTLNTWSHTLSAADTVVHAAAPMTFWGEWTLFENQIVMATIALYRAANHAGVSQFIYISSESVLQGDKPLLDITEAEPYPAEPNSIYGRAKKMAEIRLRQSHFDTSIIILRPSFIWGPGCAALENICAMARHGRFVWLDNGASAFERVHVDNVVEAIVLAFRHRRDGLYLLTDDDPGSVREFLEPVFRSQHLAIPRNSLPSFLLKPAARGMELLWQSLNIKRAPLLTRFEVAFLSQPRRYDISHVCRELGYEPVINTATGMAHLEGVLA